MYRQICFSRSLRCRRKRYARQAPAVISSPPTCFQLFQRSSPLPRFNSSLAAPHQSPSYALPTPVRSHPALATRLHSYLHRLLLHNATVPTQGRTFIPLQSQPKGVLLSQSKHRKRQGLFEQIAPSGKYTDQAFQPPYSTSSPSPQSSPNPPSSSPLASSSSSYKLPPLPSSSPKSSSSSASASSSSSSSTSSSSSYSH